MVDAPKTSHGLTGVIIGETRICDIDGQNGRLSYRGVPIETLKDRAFEDVAFLLLEEKLPSKAEGERFRQELAAFRHLPDPVVRVLQHCHQKDPFAALQTGLSALDLGSKGSDAAWLGTSASIIAHHHAIRNGRDPLLPDPSLDHVTDFLRRLYGSMPSAGAARAINADFILHAEHGACASTLAVRVAASEGSDLRAAIQAGLSCLSGGKHGGAVSIVGKLLDELDTPKAAIEFVKNEIEIHKRAVPGFGHRVYKVEDPRSRLYKAIIDGLSPDKRPPIVDIANALVERMKPMARFGIAPNDDLAAATLYNVLDLPSDLNLSLFAASRIAGWIAHFHEAQSQAEMQIPDLHYVGP